jgi:hypothetical protein
VEMTLSLLSTSMINREVLITDCHMSEEAKFNETSPSFYHFYCIV